MAHTLADAATEKDDKKKKKKAAETGSITALTSALGGPAGLASAGLQAGASLVDTNVRKKAAERAEHRPKRRRLAAGLETFKSKKREREMALATLAQATMDWASAIR
jgi:hypothetical protein